ncbi:MAG: TSUP family transporter [Promethearchaeota archaeon]
MFRLILLIIILAFIFETLDSAAGMGFGTCMAPILFLLGYSPLQIVPTLLISQAITGLTNAFFDHEFGNVNFSFRPLNDTTRFTFLVAIFGCLAIFFSIFLIYFTFKSPVMIIKIYVAILVLSMGLIGLSRLRIKENKNVIFKPKLFIAFSALAGFNKGIGGGGYGPVMTMGQIYSGVYEKSATAIVSLAEALVSITGIITFFLISLAGIELDLVLLPSIFTGGFIAAILSPYLVRIMPNLIWKILIPIYTIIMGIVSLLLILVY